MTNIKIKPQYAQYCQGKIRPLNKNTLHETSHCSKINMKLCKTAQNNWVN